VTACRCVDVDRTGGRGVFGSCPPSSHRLDHLSQCRPSSSRAKQMQMDGCEGKRGKRWARAPIRPVATTHTCRSGGRWTSFALARSPSQLPCGYLEARHERLRIWELCSWAWRRRPLLRAATDVGGHHERGHGHRSLPLLAHPAGDRQVANVQRSSHVT
jgi:hypothetical protein